MNTVPGMILVVISGICWSIVYIECIRIGFREKTYCMPLFPLGLNIAWEAIYSYYELFGRDTVRIQGFANAAWVILDVMIVVTYFWFAGNEAQTEMEKKWTVPFGVMAIAAAFVIQFLFIYEFGDEQAEIYSAYLQNIVMSVAYLYLLRSRRSSRGQSKRIAVCKWIGTLAPTLVGAIESNLFIVVTGIICFVFDGLYWYFLNYVIKEETEKSSSIRK